MQLNFYIIMKTIREGFIFQYKAGKSGISIKTQLQNTFTGNRNSFIHPS